MTQNYEIKNRWTGEVLFSCEIPDGMESGMIARHAVETAIAESANLRDADLGGANLRDANLRGANLGG
ncbi:pentapeptide repeat-containing protein, partial [Acinetobacter ursingii]|uniref:pentapeptide repeat-containing protein n=1 Tax=Acinetobacter ursingii TaxID=108980 RepID=UPI00313E2FA5